MHPKFDRVGVGTHDLQIMTVHFMSLRRKLYITTGPSATLLSPFSAQFILGQNSKEEGGNSVA